MIQRRINGRYGKVYNGYSRYCIHHNYILHNPLWVREVQEQVNISTLFCTAVVFVSLLVVYLMLDEIGKKENK